MITLLGLCCRPPTSQRELEDQICWEIADSCQTNKVVKVGDFNFPNLDRDCQSAKGMDGIEFTKCIQESFLK